MSDEAAPVVNGAVIQAAWRTVQLLDEPGGAGTVGIDEVRTVVDRHGHGEIARGLIVLIATLLHSFAVPEQQSSSADEDSLSLVFPVMMRRFRRQFPGMDAAGVLPTVAAVLTAALTGTDAVKWHDRHSPATLAEIGGLTFLLWLVRDFVDITVERHGAADELLADLFATDT